MRTSDRVAWLIKGDPLIFMVMAERRGTIASLSWLIAGILVGAALGLFLGWVAWPLEITDANPAVLEETYQRDYALMVATSYSADGNLTAARGKLAALEKDNLENWLLSFTVESILDDQAATDIRRLVNLSTALGLYSPLMDPYLPGDRGETGQ